MKAITNYNCNLTQISSQHKIPTFHSILQFNISLHHDIYCDSGLPYYTRLFTLVKHNFIIFSSKCNDDVLFLSYNHLH